MFLAKNVIGELRKIHAPKHENYEAILSHVFDSNPPIFSQDKFSLRYGELAQDDEWFANALVSNSCLEGYGAKQIWAFSNMLDNDQFARSVRRHALDESRHSTMFMMMLDLTFPGVLASLDPETKQKIWEMQPRFSTSNHPAEEKVPLSQRLFEIESINQLVQVHITEIRALVLQNMVRQALIKHAPPENLPRLMRMSDVLISDEARHINYSAEIFEHYACNHRDFFFHMFESRFQAFNELTKMELEREEIDL